METTTTTTAEPTVATPGLNKASSSTESVDTKTRPIPDEATWKLIRETYRKVKQDSLDDWDNDILEAFAAGSTAFYVPFEVRQTEGKGRGLFATQRILKGACVREDRSGHFVSESQWREFLASLPHDLAADAVSWAYVEEYEGKQAVCLDLDEGSLMNHGEDLRACCLFKQKEGTANLEEREHGGKWHLHASRDIQPDEELLCDYDDFHDYDHKVTWFDETWEEYIGDDSSGVHDY